MMDDRKKYWRTFSVLPILLTLSLSHFLSDSSAQGEEKPVEVVADSLEYAKDQNKIIGKGNVVVTYRDLKLEADRVEVFTDTKKARADGHVTLFDRESTLSGDHGEYDFNRRTGSFPKGKGYEFPWYTSGDQIDQLSKDEIRVRNGQATTCNLERPHYDVTSQWVTIYPNDKIVLRNCSIKILGRKVFWLPYLAIPLDERESPIEIQTGYSSNFGFYVLTAKNFSLSKNVKLKGHFDFRTKRGIAGGADLAYKVDKFGRGKIVTYLVDDKRAPTAGPENQDNPFVNRQDETRYRLTVRHRTDFDPWSNVIVNWHELSDEFLLQEFFQREDRKETRPTSQAVVTRNRDEYGVFAQIQKRTNKFFSEIEKLPRLNFTWKNQPLFDTKLLYRHQEQFANFQKRFAHQAREEDTVRIDTSHEIQYPFRVMDSRVKVTPYANLREAFYGKNRFGEDNLVRSLLGYGLETRTRYEHTFDVASSFLGIEVNKLRHLFEPIFRTDAIRVDSAPPGELFQMDEFDALHKHDLFQLALDNRFQTKRDRGGLQRVDLVSYNTFLNYELNGGRQGGSSLTDWGHEVVVRPYDWLLLEARTIFDFTLQDFREYQMDVVLEPDERIKWIFSQGYLAKHPAAPDMLASNLLSTDLLVKINELWKLGSYLRWELESGTVEEWEIRAIRDLHDFLLTLGVNVRKSDFRGGEGTNKEAFVEFTMKAFPGVTLGVGSRASIVRPRIGRYYNGSNAEEGLPSRHYGVL